MTIVFNGTTGITTPSDLINQDALGYTAGAGGTVTQLTSKSTPVTLDKPTGQITTNNAALAGGATVTFTCTNSFSGLTDIIIANISTAGQLANYSVRARADNGTIGFLLKNETAGSLSDAITINFAVIKGSAS